MQPLRDMSAAAQRPEVHRAELSQVPRSKVPRRVRTSQALRQNHKPIDLVLTAVLTEPHKAGTATKAEGSVLALESTCTRIGLNVETSRALSSRLGVLTPLPRWVPLTKASSPKDELLVSLRQPVEAKDTWRLVIMRPTGNVESARIDVGR